MFFKHHAKLSRMRPKGKASSHYGSGPCPSFDALFIAWCGKVYPTRTEGERERERESLPDTQRGWERERERTREREREGEKRKEWEREQERNRQADLKRILCLWYHVITGRTDVVRGRQGLSWYRKSVEVKLYLLYIYFSSKCLLNLTVFTILAAILDVHLFKMH